MRNTAIGLGLAAALLSTAAAEAAPVLWVHDNSGLLATVDVPTGTVTPIGNMGAVMTDIAFDPSGNLYGITFTDLYRIDRTTGASTLIGHHGVPGGNALVFGADGTLYSAGYSGTNLYTIDPNSGASTSLFNLGAASAGDLAFKDGEFYLSATNDQLIDIDLASASASPVGPFGFNSVFGLATADNDVMYGVAGTQIFSVDVATGAGTLVSNYGGQGLGASNGSSFFTEAGAEPGPGPGPQPTPEPASLGLLAAGLAGLGVLGRRRKAG